MTATRGERKERTRRAILDAALELSDEQTMAALSLRQVARQVGIVPTAFYRHFASLDDLGLALVEESFVSLRSMMREVRRGDPAFDKVIDRSLDVLVEHVHAQRAHFGFIARERAAGPPVVREEIRHQIELFERELATDLARLPGTDAWSSEDLHVLANLIVTSVVSTAEQIISARPDAEARIVSRARTQLRMVLIGALNWQSRG
ncbi:TetR family transcriptional regulator [Nocardioides euryhalodurans]|uniref:TetR family transcriptional regulator n=1 Tax=Nocardioides euryhalodurans TaxID=2518370 RepID=A0A4P7GJ36_9ACTN|nr:TetR family transcriptional regulator [Nocardioides euryhalodurans]QBR91749.1 TetR family transcriptional regulator [Nocardioides euryhalodurans]